MRVIPAIDPSNGVAARGERDRGSRLADGTTICVLTVVEVVHAKGLPAVNEDTKRAAQTRVEAATEKLVLGAKFFLTFSWPKKAILNCAQEWEADLVMVGSRGLGHSFTIFSG